MTTPATFCPHCLCPACVAHSRMLWEQQQSVANELAERALSKRILRDREANRRDQLMQQAAMIWMLTNHAQNSTEAKEIMNDIAIALDLAPSMVNARRRIYVTKLNSRAKISDGNFQWKPPGTRGMDEPEFCEKCGGIGSKGKPCRRSSCR